MTNNLKCPFCGAELKPKTDIQNDEPIRASCNNPRCPWFMWAFPWEIWQALIDSKAAQDALMDISKILLLQTNKPTVLTVKGKQEIRRRIASITKQEPKNE